MKKNIITEYAIIDHVGSLESEAVAYAVYRKAYSLIRKGLKAYKFSELCYNINPNIRNLKGMKNSLRQERCPKQVVVIITEENTTTEWIIKQWLERVNDVTVLYADGSRIYTYTGADYDPSIFQTWESSDSKARRCASIWASALDYTFSAPLYAEDKGIQENYLTRNNASADIRVKAKITTRPEKFRATKAVASEAEVNQFFDYYKYLYKNNLLEEFLAPDYDLCTCGRPIHHNAEKCQWCDRENPNFIEEFLPFYEESVEEEAEA